MAHAQILSLAQDDGWLAVYDPTNTSARTVSGGRVTRLADGLGNLPDLVGSSTAPELEQSAFGQLAGLRGYGGSVERHLRGSFGRTVEQPNTIFALAQRASAESTPSGRYILDGISENNRQAIFVSGVSSNPVRILATSNASHASGSEPVTPNAHLYCASFRGRESELIANGQSNHYGLRTQNTHGLTGLTMGGAYGGNHWSGTFGAVLIYDGEIPLDVANRMHDLIHQLTGIPYDEPGYAAGSRVLSVSGSGEVTTRHGASDAVTDDGIASMTKMVTAIVARKYLTTDTLLDERAEVSEDDIWSLSGDRFQPGDLVRCRDLIYSLGGVSDNTAPRTLARHVGAIILDGDDGDPYERFLDEMRSMAADRGWEEFTVSQPGGGARLTPRSVTELVRELGEDSFLVDAFSTDPWPVSITGPDARDITLEMSDSASHAYWMPGFIAGKGGLAGGRRHYAALWEHPDGTEHATVVMDLSTSVDRYQYLRRAMVNSMTGTGLGFPSRAVTEIGMRVRDFSYEPIPGIQVWFHPVGSGLALGSPDLFAEKPVKVDTAGAASYFYVRLTAWHTYRMEVTWPDGDESRTGQSWWSAPFTVPVAGDDELILLPDLLTEPSRKGVARVVQSEPTLELLDRYVFNEATGELFERAA